MIRCLVDVFVGRSGSEWPEFSSSSLFALPVRRCHCCSHRPQSPADRTADRTVLCSPLHHVFADHCGGGAADRTSVRGTTGKGKGEERRRAVAAAVASRSLGACIRSPTRIDRHPPFDSHSLAAEGEECSQAAGRIADARLSCLSLFPVSTLCLPAPAGTSCLPNGGDRGATTLASMRSRDERTQRR